MNKSIPTPLLLLMAIAVSASAANLYYSQPLLPFMGAAFGVSQSSIGFIPFATQIGYATAILLISPLGDTMVRRTLVNYLSILLTTASLAVLLAPSFAVLVIAFFLIGIGASITHQLIPLGAALSNPETRGKTLGTLMTGLTVGILLSRTLSGSIAEYYGWRAVFFVTTILAALIGILLRAYLPSNQPKVSLGYFELIQSMFVLLKKHKLLRDSTLVGASWFAAFSALWATLAIHVTDAPLFLTVQQAGLFGLIGLAGIFGAKASGQLVESVGPRRLITIALMIVVLSFVVLATWGDSISGLVVGIILLDLGVFAAQIPTQVRVFSIDPDAQSRLNAVYMLGYYTAAALGSLAGVKVMSTWGWTGVSIFGLILATAGLLYHLKGKSTE